MEIPDPVSNIIFNKATREIWSVAPTSSVFEAIKQMSERNIGALLVMDGDRLLGIVSERDYTRKVILKGRSSKNTAVEDIMTSEVICVDPDADVLLCLRTMSKNDIRHLPVVSEERVVGMLSIGDLVRRRMAVQGAMIDQLENYMHGGYPA